MTRFIASLASAVPPTVTQTRATPATQFSTTSTSFVDVTGMTVTLQTTGTFLANSNLAVEHNIVSTAYGILDQGGTDIGEGLGITTVSADNTSCIALTGSGTSGGEALHVEARTSGNTLSVDGDNSVDLQSHLVTYEVS